MTTQVAEKREGYIARPLKILVPLIKDDLERADEAGIPYYRAAGEKLIEACDGSFNGKRHGKEFAAWSHRTFGLSTNQTRRYIEFADATRGRVARDESMREVQRQRTGSDSTGKTTWHSPVKQALDRASNIRNLHEENLKREAEREAERKLGLQLIEIGFKALATKLHPDHGGSREAMARLNHVRDRLKKFV